MSNDVLKQRLAQVKTAAVAASPTSARVVMVEESAPERTPVRRAARGDSWDDRVVRKTFLIDVDLLEQFESTVRRTGRSRKQILDAALRRHLAEI